MNIEKQYLELLQDILDNGVEKKDRTGTGTISVFGRQIRHKMSEGFPLLTTKKMAFRTMVTELLWFLRGSTRGDELVREGCNIWVGDMYANYKKYAMANSYGVDILSMDKFIQQIKTDDEFAKKWGELGPIYGKQWRAWTEYYVGKFNGGNPIIVERTLDQIQNLINDLKTNPDSRRLMVSAWNVGELDQMVLPPCHFSFQCYSHENNGKRYLSLAWNQRSVDTFLGLPFNIASYALLLEIIAKEVNMVPDELIGNLGDVHLYKNHIEQAKEQIGRKPFELPQLSYLDEYHYLTDVSLVGEIPFNKKIEEFRPDFFKVVNYQSHPAIKAPLSN